MWFLVNLHLFPDIAVVVNENSHEQMVFVTIEILLDICSSRVLRQLEQLIFHSWVFILRGRRLRHIAWDIFWVEVFNMMYFMSPIKSQLPLVISLIYLLEQILEYLLLSQRFLQFDLVIKQFRSLLFRVEKHLLLVLEQAIQRLIVKWLPVVVWGFRIKRGLFWRLVDHSTLVRWLIHRTFLFLWFSLTSACLSRILSTFS